MRKLKRALPILLIVIGVFLLLSPFIMEQIVKYNNKINYDMFEINEDAGQIEVDFDFSAIDDIDIWALLKGTRSFDTELVIGTMLIPDLDINLPIMKGLTNSNLAVGAATMKAEQEFGHGNYALAGHYMKNKDLLFGSLMDIQIGSSVYISDGGKIYEYEIYDMVVVPDTDMDVISDDRADDRGKPIISLMTCYYSSKTGKRFFAFGELVDVLEV